MLALALPLVLAASAMSAVTATASSTTTITASPKVGVAGQKVTFTATFTACAGTIQPHYFTIDGKKYNGKLVVSGKNGTETYSTSTLAVGTHVVSYYWQTADAHCIGQYTIQGGFVVKKATASPSPRPSPSPTPSPSPSPTSAPSPSPSPVVLVSTKVDDSPLAYLGVALVLVSVVAGVGLVILGRR